MNEKYILKKEDERLSKRNKELFIRYKYNPCSLSQVHCETGTGHLSMCFIRAQFPNTGCSQRPPRSLGGSGNCSPLCTPGPAANLCCAPANSTRTQRTRKEHSQGVCCPWGRVSQGICSCGVRPGCLWLTEHKLHPPHTTSHTTFVGLLSQGATRGFFL